LARPATGSQPHLTAGIGGSLMDDDLVAAFGGYTRGFEARGPGAHDHYPALDCGRRDLMGYEELAPGGRIVDAIGRAARADAIEAVVRSDTGPNIAFPLRDDLANNVGIGHVRSGHADHVNFTGRDRMPRGRHILDTSRMKSGELGCGADFTRKIQVG